MGRVKLFWWRPRAPGRVLSTVGIGAVLAAAFAGAGLAAVRYLVFEDVAAVSDAELAGMRGGFSIPSLPHVQFSFGFLIRNRVDLPGNVNLPDSVHQVVSPSVVAILDSGDGRSTGISSTGAVLPKPSGTRLGSTTTVQFTDPARAVVRTVKETNGTVVSDTQEQLVDLTKDALTLKLGPDAAQITQHLDAHQVTTLMKSVLGNTSLRSDLTASIAVDGWKRFRSTLPSAATVRGVRAVEDAVKMSLH